MVKYNEKYKRKKINKNTERQRLKVWFENKQEFDDNKKNIFNYKWNRIIIDESTKIKEKTAKRS